MLDFGFYNIDCMKGMREFPDKYFDLAIIDPPYGIGDKFKGGESGRLQFNEIVSKGWDVPPKDDFFNELFRVSKNQIIWGGNYFNLPPTRCFIVWRKLTISDNFSMSMAEYAWTSFSSNSKVFECPPQGRKGERFHPTQKPVVLYEWLINKYAKENDIILDTHVGSASSLIACRKTGHKYVGFEIDKEYYKLAKDRLNRIESQINLFDLKEEVSQKNKVNNIQINFEFE